MAKKRNISFLSFTIVYKTENKNFHLLELMGGLNGNIEWNSLHIVRRDRNTKYGS